LLSPTDVALARRHNVDGVIISNHGGRQLDHAVSPMRVLKAAVEAARGMPVMVDSGFRRGTDILKALALGASFVFIGRPFLFAAAYAGKEGVKHAIKLLHREIDKDMALVGVRKLADITEEMIIRTATPEACAGHEAA
jgi:L-lactate dehydrogenase (cytochrome)